jgi:hypothetical protein
MPPVVKKNLGGLQDCHHVTGHKLMTVPSTVVRSRNVPIRVAPATFLHSGLRVSPDHFAFCIPVQPEPAVGRAFASRSQRPPREGGLGEQRKAYLPSPRYRRRSAGWSMYHGLHMSQRPVCRTTQQWIQSIQWIHGYSTVQWMSSTAWVPPGRKS